MRFLFILIYTLTLYGKTMNTTEISVVHKDRRLVNEYYQELKNLSDDQKFWLSEVYKTCLEYDLGYTCVAIAWEESKFNKWGDNEAGDYGLMGINLYWYMIDNGLNYRNKYRRIEVRTRLIRDSYYNLRYSISKLIKLRKKHKNNWFKIWGCYNGGTTPNYYYSRRILNRIYAFRKWLKTNN